MEKPENPDSPPSYQKIQILHLDFMIFGADPPPPPFGLFPLFVKFFCWMAPPNQIGCQNRWQNCSVYIFFLNYGQPLYKIKYYVLVFNQIWWAQIITSTQSYMYMAQTNYVVCALILVPAFQATTSVFGWVMSRIRVVSLNTSCLDYRILSWHTPQPCYTAL